MNWGRGAWDGQAAWARSLWNERGTCRSRQPSRSDGGRRQSWGPRPTHSRRGGKIDRRTDVWEFVWCIYEALTGEKASRRDRLEHPRPDLWSVRRTGKFCPTSSRHLGRSGRARRSSRCISRWRTPKPVEDGELPWLSCGLPRRSARWIITRESPGSGPQIASSSLSRQQAS